MPKKGNYLTFPMPVINITQGYSGSYSHAPHVNGRPRDYPIDICGATSNLDYFYCPCNEAQVMRIARNTNIVWLQSTEPVILANGAEDYVSMMIIHPNDDNFIGANACRVGRIYKRYEPIVREGTSGRATGPHIHLAIGKGKFKGTGGLVNSQGAYVNSSTGIQLKPEEAFWRQVSLHSNLYSNEYITSIRNSAGLNFKTIEGKYIDKNGTTIFIQKDGQWYNVDTVWCYDGRINKWRQTTPFIYNNGWHAL